MAPRAYWKGYLKLSLVSCPIALYPATSEREKISFNQINRQTGHRIRYVKVDAESGEEVGQDEIVKGYQVARGEYIELTPEEIEAVAIESRRTIDIDAFVPRDEIIAPDGEVGEQAFASSARRSADRAWWRWRAWCSPRASTSSRSSRAARGCSA